MSDSPFHDLRRNVLLYTSRNADGLIPRDTEQSDGIEFHAHVAEMVVDSLAGEKDPPFQHLMLSGEPSSGKTTELKRIATALLDNEFGKQQVMPVYSELQYAVSGSTNDLWANLVSGSADPQLASIEQSKSIKYLKKAANDQGKKLVLFIDTLDILLLDGGKDIAKNWAEFLSLATEHAVHVIWTCRPYEWKFFKKEFPQKMNSVTKKISLPPLSLYEIDYFSLPENTLSEYDENVRKSWLNWSLQLQSKMPLFAQRNQLPHTDYRRLNETFSKKLADKFKEMFQMTIHRQNPLKLLKNHLPTNLYYSWMWDTITGTMVQHYAMGKEACRQFKHIFEDCLSDNVIAQTSNLEASSLRLRFDLDMLFEELHKSAESPFSDDDLVHMLNVAESYGLIDKFGSWFEFSHQLLFEEALYSSSQRKRNNRHTNFPSIQIRSIREGVNASEGEINENYESIIHWMGGLYGYHPEVRRDSRNLGLQWMPWIEYATEHLSKLDTLYTSPMDELGEKYTILKNFIGNPTKKALFLNGAPGTGKTYFCYHFLEYHMMQESDPIDWRYVTLSEPLVDHFSAGWDNYLKLDLVDHRLIRRTKNTPTQEFLSPAMSVFAILRKFHPKLVQGPRTVTQNSRVMENILNGTSIGLLTFPKFKQLFNRFCDDYKGNFNRPAVGDAWREYLQCWHEPNTGEKLASLEQNVKNMNIRGNDRKVFNRFVGDELGNWKTYDQACYEASEKFLKMGENERKQYQHDLLMIDEIQDITPPILTLLLLLCSDKANNKRILLTGDRFQTVNRSGFDWGSITRTCSEALSSSLLNISKPFETKLLDAIDIYSDESTHVQTLRTPWRCAPTITTFNDHLRQGFGKRYNIPLLDYDVEPSLNLSNEAREREDSAQVTLVVCPDDSDFYACIDMLKHIEFDVGERGNTALLTPYSHEIPQLDNFASFTTYNAETVKGLEFDNIIVAQPYELLYSEALSSLGLDPVKAAPMNASRLESWVESDSPEAREKLDMFVHDLYDNIRTRMNVLFSRAKFRMVVLLRQKLGEGWLVNPNDKDNPTIVIDYPNPFPEFKPNQIKLKTLRYPFTGQELHDSLLLDVGVGNVSHGSRIERAIDEEKNSDGSSYQNVKNLWRSYLEYTSIDSDESVFRSASLLGGFVDNKRRNTTNIPSILHVFRSSTLDEDQANACKINIQSENEHLYEKFVMALHDECHLDDQRYFSVPGLVYADLVIHLEAILDELLKEAAKPEVFSKHPRLLQVILKEVLGVNSYPEGPIASGYIEPAKGLRILLDPELVNKNNGLVVQLERPTINEIEAAWSRSSERVHFNLDGDHIHVRDQILAHMWHELQGEHSKIVIENTRTVMEKAEIGLGLVSLPEHSSYWLLVKEDSKFLPTDWSLTANLAVSIMMELYSDQNPSHNVIGPFPYPLDEDRTFDYVLLNWLVLSQNMINSNVGPHIRILANLYIFLSQPPTRAMCENLVVSKYSRLSNRYQGLGVWDQESSEVIDIIDCWSETISTFFGFTRESMEENTHPINDARFSMDQFQIELPLFNPKIHYLAGIDSTQLSEIMTKYLTKFIKSSVYYFKEAGKNENPLQQSDIAEILQEFIQQDKRDGTPDARLPVIDSILPTISTFGVTLDIPGIYNSEIIKTFLPLLLIVESTFERSNLRLTNKKIEVKSINNAQVYLEGSDPYFEHCYQSLINHDSSMTGNQTDVMLETYLDLVSSVVPEHIRWKAKTARKSRVENSNLVYQEHMYYWAHLIRLLDLRKDIIGRKVREKYCPHYLLPLYYHPTRQNDSDKRAAMILEAIEEMRERLRNVRNEGQTQRWLRRVLAYVAPPSPGDTHKKLVKFWKKDVKKKEEEVHRERMKHLIQHNDRIEAGYEEKRNNALREELSNPPLDLFIIEASGENLGERWDVVTPGLSNPTRRLALQCLRRANHPPYFLDWSIFLMLSTISYNDKAKQYKEDVEISLNSINLSLTELVFGESDHPPNINIKDLKPLIDSFLKMLEDPYTELGHRFNFADNKLTLLQAIRSSQGYTKHNNEHPVVKAEIVSSGNQVVRMYFEAMKHAFLAEYNQFNPGSTLDLALEEE
jgi:hypothetical protein